MENINKEIPYLYDNINFETLPNSIYTKIGRYGNERSFSSYTNKEGKRITKYGEKIPPSYVTVKGDDYNFMILYQCYDRYEKFLKTKEYSNKKGDTLNTKTIIPYLKEYSKGFHFGYDNYKGRIKGSDNLFSLSNETIADKIYSDLFDFQRSKGQIGFTRTQDIKHRHITKELMHNAGLNGGEFYKGLEIVLNNPLVFEPIFIKYNEKEKTIKTDTIDYSETKGTEKIIFLKQLGILDHLKEKQPFDMSTNALASAISGFTGIKAGTVQSYINPINNPTTDQKNNPLNTEKAVQKVNNKLLSIGYKPPK